MEFKKIRGFFENFGRQYVKYTQNFEKLEGDLRNFGNIVEWPPPQSSAWVGPCVRMLALMILGRVEQRFGTVHICPLQ